MVISSRKQATKVKKETEVTKAVEVSEAVGPKEAYAVGRYLRISPTKVRGVLDLIRGETVEEAKRILRFSPKKGAKITLKVLNSAVANVRGGVDENRWVVIDARADKGPLFRRKLDPKARGGRGMITTPATHLKIVISQKPVASSQKNEKMVNEKMSKLPTKSRSAGRKEAKGGS